jgi:hypothetical protein
MYSSTQTRLLRHVPSAAFAAWSRPRIAATRSAFAETSFVARAGRGPNYAGPATAGTINLERLSSTARAKELPEWPRISSISTPERLQVAAAVALVDDRWRKAEPDEHQIEDQTSGSSVAVEKRVNLLKSGMERRRFSIRDGSVSSAGDSPCVASRASWTGLQATEVGAFRLGTVGCRADGNAPGVSRIVALG